MTEIPGQKPVNLESSNKQTAKQKQESEGRVPAELHIPAAVISEYKSNQNKAYGLEKMKLTIEVLTLLAIVWYAIVASGQLAQMRNATKAAKESADAASRAASTAAEQFDLSERPWLSVQVKPAIPGPGLWWANPTQAALSIDVSVSNVGKSIARDIQVDANLVPSPPGLPIATDAVQSERNLCRHANLSAANWFDLFPNAPPVDRNLSIGATSAKVLARALADPQTKSRTFVGFYVVGCVSYLSTYASEVHQTAFAYQLVPPSIAFQSGRPLMLPNGLPAIGFELGKNVPATKLGWMQEPLAPNDAD